MSTWARLITKPETVGRRAVSSDSVAPREDRIDSPGELLVPAVKYGLMQRMAALVEDSNDPSSAWRVRLPWPVGTEPPNASSDIPSRK
jgi:hypothetical protein